MVYWVGEFAGVYLSGLFGRERMGLVGGGRMVTWRGVGGHVDGREPSENCGEK